MDTVKDRNFIPDTDDDLLMMMETFLLEKAVFELNFELSNRPEYVMVPLLGIKGILEKIDTGR